MTGLFRNPINSVVLQIGLRCPLRCTHCYVSAGPEKTEILSESAIRKVIRGYGQYGEQEKKLVITGGEPFAMPNLLSTAYQEASRFGIPIFVNTSGFFAKTPKLAMEILRPYKGFAQLEVSSDSYHEEFVDRAIAANAVSASVALSIPTQLAVQADEWEGERMHFWSSFSGKVSVCLQEFAPIGDRNYECKSSTSTRQLFQGCGKVGHLVFDEYGHAYPCSSAVAMSRRLPNGRGLPGFHLGSIHKNTFREIADLLIHGKTFYAIRRFGPSTMQRHCAADVSIRPRSNTYCDTCIDIHCSGSLHRSVEGELGVLMDLAEQIGK